jgi:hypothetical protein
MTSGNRTMETVAEGGLISSVAPCRVRLCTWVLVRVLDQPVLGLRGTALSDALSSGGGPGSPGH